jgi:hypothetical protein
MCLVGEAGSISWLRVPIALAIGAALVVGSIAIAVMMATAGQQLVGRIAGGVLLFVAIVYVGTALRRWRRRKEE